MWNGWKIAHLEWPSSNTVAVQMAVSSFYNHAKFCSSTTKPLSMLPKLSNYHEMGIQAAIYSRVWKIFAMLMSAGYSTGIKFAHQQSRSSELSSEKFPHSKTEISTVQTKGEAAAPSVRPNAICITTEMTNRLWIFGNRFGEFCVNWLCPLSQGKFAQSTHQ